MHNLDEIIKIYFNYVSVADIFSFHTKAYDFEKDEYMSLAAAYLDCYSDTEQNNLYDYIKSGREMEGHNYARERGRSGLNVFAALEELTADLFVLEENEAKCCYEHLLRLRNIEEYVDLDLLIAAFLIQQSGNRSLLKQKFMVSNVTVSHNNLQLHRIMEQGIAENHFHLYGSAPMFHLLWIQMMNEIDSESYTKLFQNIDNRPRTVRIHYKHDYSENESRKKVMKAALIRFYLVKMLFNEKCGIRRLEEERKAEKWDEGKKEEQEVKKSKKVKKVKSEELTSGLIRKILSDEYDIKDYCGLLQKEIRVLRAMCQIRYGQNAVDYAMADIEIVNSKGNRFAVLAGERCLLYELLKKEYRENPGGKGEVLQKGYEWVQWFYAYLVIKNQVRNELLQTNSKVGFENFSIISHRKNVYSDYKIMEKLAISGSMENENIEKFEIRISPGRTAEENALKIQNLESSGPEDKNKKKAIYYVLHFTKEKDKCSKSQAILDNRKECRHSKLRNDLEEKANAVEEFRNKYPKYAVRVLGIDACAQEIGCRPEVFAPIFRRLAEHTSMVSLGNCEVPQLRMTYHVGEDFLDVADGLRAVDEAVRFLNLKCGSRIGHGTVLGISVEKWYRKKRNTIILSRQDYLDNIVWLYHKINEFHIEGCSQLLEFLQQEFEEMFYIVYRKNIDMEEVRRIWKESEREYSGKQCRLREYQYDFNIFTYYDAWKLRGDVPYLYSKGYYEESAFFIEKQRKMVNMNYPKPFEIRKQRDVSILYYYYHFNWLVYEDGKQKIEKVMPDCYVDGVIKVQKAMQNFIGKCGIGIECNPSSNLMISTMDNYEEHPIVQFYNKDLEKEQKKLQECLQLFVSINTDDKGIFHTSLENEYALMACAMEKVKDKQGNYVYNRQMIYQWLDNIRKMGLQQSFMGRSQSNDKERYEE